MRDPRRFDLRDHPGKLILAAPCLAAGIGTAGNLAMLHAFRLGWAVPRAVTVAVGLSCLLIAVFGAAGGGLLVRGTLARRVASALAAGACGLAAYVAASFAALYVLASLDLL